MTNNGDGPQHVGAITGVVDPNSLPAGCQAGWFTIAPISSPGTLSPGETVDLGSSVILDDSGVNQNACASTTVHDQLVERSEQGIGWEASREEQLELIP